MSFWTKSAAPIWGFLAPIAVLDMPKNVLRTNTVAYLSRSVCDEEDKSLIKLSPDVAVEQAIPRLRRQTVRLRRSDDATTAAAT